MLKPLCLFLVAAPALMMAQTDVAGTWLATTDIFGNPPTSGSPLRRTAAPCPANSATTNWKGTLNGAGIHFMTKNDSGGSSEYNGTVTSDSMTGTVVTIDGDTKEHTNATFTAKRVAERNPGPPARHEFVPTTFYRRFSPDTKPVLTI